MFSFILLSCNNNETNNQFNFKSSFLNQEGLPIIEFKTNNKKINFIIDTGSDLNLISEKYFIENKNNFIIIDSIQNDITTVNGKILNHSYIVQMNLNDSIPLILRTFNIDNVVDNVFDNQYVLIQGIIGVKFLYENNIILDFNKKIMLINTDTICTNSI